MDLGRSKWTITASAFALGTLLVYGGVAVADDDVSFTGCLNNGGSIRSIAVGSEPSGPCTGTAQQVTWNATGAEGAEGPEGPVGPEGPEGAEGPAGPAGLFDIYSVTGFDWLVPGNTTTFQDVFCEEGDKATGFSARIGDLGDGIELDWAALNGSRGYRFTWHNSSSTDAVLPIAGTVICADLTP